MTRIQNIVPLASASGETTPRNRFADILNYIWPLGANMIAASRFPGDGLGDAASIATGIDTGPETLTRQEDTHDAEIGNIVNKFGANMQQRPVSYGEYVDYSQDLTSAHEAVAMAKAAHFDVPEELKHKYPTWWEVIRGAEDGSYEHDLANLTETKKRAAEKLNPPTPPGEIPPEQKGFETPKGD